MRRALLAAVFTMLVFPAAAAAKDTTYWATVNVCDTTKQPDQIGIRAAMPGTPKGARLSMRFRVQYKAGEDWKDVADADSGWVNVGVAKGPMLEYGWSFTFAKGTKSTLLRGCPSRPRRPPRPVIAPARARTRRAIPPPPARLEIEAGQPLRPTPIIRPQMLLNRRGSFVMIPVTPSFSSRVIRGPSSTVHT